MPTIKGDLVPCENGYHLCRKGDLVRWLGETLYEAEYEGDIIEFDNKVVVRRARLLRTLEEWNERTAGLFACDCAERVLPLFEAEYPGDKRPREALDVARRYAVGNATHEELSAARDAAWAAARAAARAAAGAAAEDAAWDAAWDAAEDAERTWQTKRLFEMLGDAAVKHA
jgi:hypothetical protein